jgi:hAT family C-terminal dimerisation region
MPPAKLSDSACMKIGFIHVDDEIEYEEITIEDEYATYIGEFHVVKSANETCPHILAGLLFQCLSFDHLWTAHSMQEHEQTYPTWFQMPVDYLPIQASSIPCEQVFSSHSKTMTKRQNCLKPNVMEALQMLKFLLKKEHLNFTRNWETQFWT